MKAIDEGRSAEANRGMAKVGFILGIVGTILSFLGLLFYVLVFLLAIFAGSQSPSTF